MGPEAVHPEVEEDHRQVEEDHRQEEEDHRLGHPLMEEGHLEAEDLPVEADLEFQSHLEPLEYLTRLFIITITLLRDMIDEMP